jgi:hypothetical protein
MLPLTQIPGGVHNYKYRGEVGVSGVGVPQIWDLSNIPENVRNAIDFDDQLYIFAKALDSDITNVDDQNVVINRDSRDLPVSMQITLTSLSATAELFLLVETKHTATR